MQWMFAAILISGASVFTACTNFGDNPAEKESDILEKVTGVWQCVEMLSGISPNTGLPYDKIVNSYIITPAGFGLYDEIWFNGDVVVDKCYDRHINGRFSYRAFDDGLLVMFDMEDQSFLKYDNGHLIDMYDDGSFCVFTKCTPEEALKVRQNGVLGMWRKIYEESGKTPHQQLQYDKQIETYFFAPDGTGFFESLYFNGGLLVEKEYDRNDTGKFAYKWVSETEIICTGFVSGEDWKVTYDRGIFTDLEDPNTPITYSKVMFSEVQEINSNYPNAANQDAE